MQSPATSWEVHLYQPGAVSPAVSERFASFDPAFSHAMTLKQQRPNGWHVHVHAPPDATEQEVNLLREHALFPG